MTGTAGLNNGRTLTFFMGTLGSRILQLLLLLRFMEQKRSNGEISGNNFGIQAHVMCIKQPIQAYLILFHFALLYFKFTVFFFFLNQLKVCGTPASSKSFFQSVSHFGNISNFFIIVMLVMVICDQ